MSSSASNDNGFHATLPLHSTSGDKYQKEMRKKNAREKNSSSGWKAILMVFVLVHVCSSAYYYNRMKAEREEHGVSLADSGSDSAQNTQTPSHYDLLSENDDEEDEKDRSLLTTKLRLELDEAKRTILTMKEESQVMQMQLNDFHAKGSNSNNNKKNALQQSGNVEAHHSSSSNSNGGIGAGLLVWNYETTGQPIEIKSTPSTNRDVALDSRPFFSIVMAAYNQGAYIDETVKSVAAQSYERWELIIVNDGSSDDSWAKASNLMDKYGKRRIRLINKRNGGLADARNVGMRYARGDWLCMLDSDDLLARDYLSRAAELVEEEHGDGGDIATTTSGGHTGTGGVDIIPGCMRNFDAVSSDWCFPEGFSIVGISHWNKFHASVLMKADLMRKVGGYDPGIPWGLEDWNFWLNAAKFNPIDRFVPEITINYRHHKGTSITVGCILQHQGCGATALFAMGST